ncbi:MAG: addiction module protein [Candidatus Schekmanbacteria bacterium]|nr:addiction module protein [Candidatus Schekmanbacteria bacterium]
MLPVTGARRPCQQSGTPLFRASGARAGQVRNADHSTDSAAIGNGVSHEKYHPGKVRAEALALPEPESAELAHELMKSLDLAVDHDAGDAWDKEILRRLAEIDAGTASLIDRDELRWRMRARLGPK